MTRPLSEWRKFVAVSLCPMTRWHHPHRWGPDGDLKWQCPGKPKENEEAE